MSILASHYFATASERLNLRIFLFLGTGPLQARMHSSYVQGTISMCSAREKLIGSKPATTQLIAERVYIKSQRSAFGLVQISLRTVEFRPTLS